MKKLFMFFVCAAALGTANAQVKFGPKAGLNLADITGSDATGYKMKAGIYAGGFARLHLSEKFAIQPELLYSGQGSKYETNVEGTIIKGDVNLNYITIPVMAQYHLPMGLYLETGPQIGFLASAKAKSGGSSTDIKDQFKSTDFSWGAGAGFQLPMGLGFNARYNFGLSKLDEGGNANAKNGVIQVGVFYAIGSGK